MNEYEDRTVKWLRCLSINYYHELFSTVLPFLHYCCQYLMLDQLSVNLSVDRYYPVKSRDQIDPTVVLDSLVHFLYWSVPDLKANFSSNLITVF